MLLLLSLAAILLGLAETNGTVRDAVSGAPVAGVLVRAVGDSSPVAVTDIAGRFTLALSEPTRLRFTRTGYAAVELPVVPGIAIDVALTPAPRALEAVTVTALRGDEAAPLSQSRRSQSEIEAVYSGQEMPLLLAMFPSITASSDAGSDAGYAYFRLRGLDQTRVNVTLDGVPLNEPEDQGVYFSNFPDLANSIHSVQVQRGVGTSAYGTASYAGAINFESVALAAAPGGAAAQITSGSYGTRRGAIEYHGGLRPSGLAAYGRVSWQTTDGYRRHSGNESGSLFLSGGYFGARHVVKTTAFTGRARNEMAYVASAADALRTDRRHNPLAADERDRFAQHFVSVSHSTALGAFTSLATTAYHVRLRGDYDVRIPPDLLNFNLASAWTGMSTTARAQRGALTVNLGAHASTYRREHWLALRPDRDVRLYTNAGRKEEASAFAKGTLAAGRVTIVADVQLRAAHFDYEADAESGISPGDIGWTFVNPKIGATVRATPRVSMYASLGRTGREPTRNDVFAGFDNLDTTNIAFVGSFDRVRPEFVTDLETGISLDAGIADIQLNGFWMEFRDEIAPIGQLSYIGLPLRKNVARSTRRGVELDARLRGIRRLDGTISAAATYSRIDEYTDDATGITHRDVDPLLTPRFTAAHDLRWTVAGPIILSVGGRYGSRAFLDNSGDRRFVLPASYVADLGVRVGGERRSIQLIVRNAANSRGFSGGQTDGTTSYYFPHAARHVMLTARAAF
jgi:iron complex outermembrane receptor protein